MQKLTVDIPGGGCYSMTVDRATARRIVPCKVNTPTAKRKGDLIMYNFNKLKNLYLEIDKKQAMGRVSIWEAYSLMDAFNEYLTTVKPTGYEITYDPINLYQVTYCENGERQTTKGCIYGFPTYDKAAMAQWAMIAAYNAGRQSKGGNDSVF